MRNFLVLIWMCLTACAADNFSTSINTNYYDVKGTNAQTLMASMRSSHPSTNDAFTSWHVSWNSRFQFGPGEATLRSYSVRVKVEYTMPRWIDAKQGDAALQKEWKRYTDALMVHEQGHKDFGVQAAREISQRLGTGTWSAPDTKELNNRIEQACDAILNKIRAREVAYDKDTTHGLTQGAIFRPIITRPRQEFRRP